MKKEKILDRVKKLLELAKDNANENEADNAMLKAQEYMARHKISQSEVDTIIDKETEPNVIEEPFTLWSKTKWWERELASVIAWNFRCYYVIYTRNSLTRLSFYGKDEDVWLAKEVYEFASWAIQYHSKQYMKERDVADRTIKTGLKNAYMKGFINGLNARYKKQVAENEWALVLVKDAIVEKKWTDRDLKKVKNKSNASFLNDAQARKDGYDEGNNLNMIKHKSIIGSR